MQKLRINQIKLELKHDLRQVQQKAAQKIGMNEEDFLEFKIVRKSIDARKKPEIYFVYSVEVLVKSMPKKVYKNKDVVLVTKNNQYDFGSTGNENLDNSPIVVGFGPAGMFCGYMLAKYGYKPIIIERGADVDARIRDVEEFWDTGRLNKESNLQFGEGGAGTFSDGKLNTTVNDKNARNQLVLETLVRFGAPQNILYDAKPHIGTDILCEIVKKIRQYIISKGGQVLFNSKLTDIITNNGCLEKIIVNNDKMIDGKAMVLAIGHSARDTFEMLYNKNITMEQKPFAVGVRVEHLQTVIDQAMYGLKDSEYLPASPYKVAAKAKDGRGVYSFCMCPGGYVVNASSEEGCMAVNGMSYSDRGGVNANSAIVTTVSPEDFGSEHPLAGVAFQRKLEEKAYNEGNGTIPVQTYGDFKASRVTKKLGHISPQIKGAYKLSNIRNVLPEYISEAIAECMPVFGRSIKGFDSDDTVLSAIESRTSSPVRIVRNEHFQSNISGIYPCGEGAGYAGGITSAAIDGVKIFEAIASKYKANSEFNLRD